MLNYTLFALLALFWGGSFVAIKNLIHDVPSFTAAFYRVFFSVIFLFIIYARSTRLHKKLINKEFWGVAAAGFFSIGLPFSLLFWGEKFISPSIAGVINGTVPFWTLIIAVSFFGGMKDVTLRKIFGLFAGFIGIAFIFGPKINLTGSEGEIWGLLSVTGMAVSYSVGINLNKNILSNNKVYTKSVNTLTQQIVAQAYLTIVMLFVDGVPEFEKLTDLTNFASVIYLSLFSTCIAFIIFYRLIEEMGPVKSSTVTFFVPMVALTLDSIIYGRVLSMYEAIGTFVILMSMLLLKQPSKNEVNTNMILNLARFFQKRA